MLDFARAARYVAGANQKGDVTSTSWTLLLDAIDGVDVVVAGEHAPISEAAIGALFPGRTRRSEARWDGPAPEVAIVARATEVTPELVGPATTVVRVGDVAAGAGVAMVPDPVWHDMAVRSLQVPFAPSERDDSGVLARGTRALQRLATRLGAPPAPVARTSAVGVGTGNLERGSTITFAPGRDARDLPAYVRRIAAEGGVPLDGRPWSMVPAADYWSQKGLFVLPPDLVVKVSRHPAFAPRLANEYEALEFVAGTQWGERHAPAPRFAGYEGALVVVGEELVDGAPLEDVPELSPTSPSLRAALDAVHELGASTRADAPLGEVADALSDLVGRYEQLAGLPTDARAVLDADIEKVAAGVSVATHGDVTPWNLVVRRSGEIVFFDWENFEQAGMPGWDVVVLVQTAASTAWSRKGKRYTAAVLVDQLLGAEGSPWRRLLVAEVASALHAVDIGDDVVMPTVRLCLVFQALKETTRHPSGHRGLYSKAVEQAASLGVRA